MAGKRTKPNQGNYITQNNRSPSARDQFFSDYRYDGLGGSEEIVANQRLMELGVTGDEHEAVIEDPVGRTFGIEFLHGTRDCGSLVDELLCSWKKNQKSRIGSQDKGRQEGFTRSDVFFKDVVNHTSKPGPIFCRGTVCHCQAIIFPCYKRFRGDL